MLKSKKTFIWVLLLLISTVLIVTCAASSDKNSENAESMMMFSDVSETDWFYEDVWYVSSKKLMNGTGEDAFSPNEPTTRGMIVTILHRLDGEGEVSGENSFADVSENAYYHKAVIWAAENKIVSGYSDTAFGPDDFITREQLAAIFYRYASYKEYDISADTTLEQYSDFLKVSEYAKDAFKWAVAHKIVSGTSETTLTPQGNASRCQVSAILRRFNKEITGEKTDMPQIPDKKPTAGGSSGGGSSAGGGATGGGSSSGSGSSSGGSSSGGNVSSGGSTENEQPIVTPEPDDNIPRIVMNTVSGNAGDTVTVIAEVKNNPGILGMILTAQYDEKALKLESVENGAAISNVLTLTASKELKSGTRFVWDGVEIGEEDIKDGSILVMNFKILNTAEEGSHMVNLSYADGDIIDNNLESVSPEISYGYVKVEKKSE